MMDVTFSRAAFLKLTPLQLEALQYQMGDNRTLSVYTDFSLPDDYVAFTRTTPAHTDSPFGPGTIMGGIDSEGRVST